jgi:hypothetical protein
MHKIHRENFIYTNYKGDDVDFDNDDVANDGDEDDSPYA